MLTHRTSGRYVRQLGGHRAFIPEELPVCPPIGIDPQMQRLMSRADRALGRLDGSIAALPNPDLFVFMYVRKEAVLSSRIEGTQASMNDLLAVEAQAFDPQTPDDVGELVNYVKAMNHGLERLSTLPLSLRLIREIHEILMRNVRGQYRSPGEFRTSQNWIGPAGASLNDASFVPPPPGELQRLLGNLESYIHSKDDVPLLLKIGIAHAQFETLHPFLDGNGRVGRLLITFLLCQRKVLIRPVLYLSHYLKRNRGAYYDHLQAIRNEGDWERWLNFFLTGVALVANEATETARQIVALRETHRSQLVETQGRGAGNALRFLDSLYQTPIFSVANAADLLAITPAAANNLVGRLVELGLVEEITGQKRNRRFSYRPYIALFSDD